MKFNPKITPSNLQDLDIDLYHQIVAELANIDRNLIDDELDNLPRVYGYYYGLQVKANRMLDRAEVILETYKSSRKTEIRSNGKKTVDALNDAVNSEKEVESLNNSVEIAREVYGYMRGLISTLDHKKDMLIQLSANRRAETQLHNK